VTTRAKKPTDTHVIDNLVSAVAAMQVEQRKSTDQVENLILMINGRIAAADASAPEYTEDELVGMWMTDQRNAGATNIDLKRVDDIRTGIRYALSGGED
jgi:hypothetical protein